MQGQYLETSVSPLVPLALRPPHPDHLAGYALSEGAAGVYSASSEPSESSETPSGSAPAGKPRQVQRRRLHPWTGGEDRMLARLVQEFDGGDVSWAHITRQLCAAGYPERTSTRVRERWLSKVGAVNKTKITPEESAEIVRLYGLLGGPRWVEIGRRLGRTDVLVKNHYNSLIKKTKKAGSATVVPAEPAPLPATFNFLSNPAALAPPHTSHRCDPHTHTLPHHPAAHTAVDAATTTHTPVDVHTGREHASSPTQSPTASDPVSAAPSHAQGSPPPPVPSPPAAYAPGPLAGAPPVGNHGGVETPFWRGAGGGDPHMPALVGWQLPAAALTHARPELNQAPNAHLGDPHAHNAGGYSPHIAHSPPPHFYPPGPIPPPLGGCPACGGGQGAPQWGGAGGMGVMHTPRGGPNPFGMCCCEQRALGGWAGEGGADGTTNGWD